VAENRKYLVLIISWNVVKRLRFCLMKSSVFFGPDLGPKFGPSPNWKFPNIFPISDLKIPNHSENCKKEKKRRYNSRKSGQDYQ
jgi:hypothetical protein